MRLAPKWLVLTYLAGVVCLSPLGAEDQNENSLLGRVKVAVSADGDLKSQLESYLKRELRDIKDVEITDGTAEWEVNIVALPLTVRGYALSTVFVRRLNVDKVGGLLSLNKMQSALLKAYSPERVLDHRLNTCPPDGLKPTCEKLIAVFDTEQLEPIREIKRSE